jgi:polar amino acid transport system substrate-binding protein
MNSVPTSRVSMKRVVTVLLIAGVLLAGCATTPAAPATTTGAIAPPIPGGVQDPAVIPSAAASTSATCGNAVASLRPTGPLPGPGAMPSGSTMAKIAARGYLIAGVDQNTYLFGYFNPTTGTNEGFDIDMVQAVSKAIFGSVKIKYVAITSAERIPYLRNHTVDIVADTMTINCARWQQVDFSSVYYNAGQSLLVAKTSKVTSLNQLGGQKVCAATGSTSIATIASWPSHPIAVSVNDWTDCLVMLQQGEVAAISTDDTILRGLAAQDPHTALVGKDFTSEPYGLAMAPDASDFVRFVNGVLQQMRTDGRWAAIYDRWLGAPAPTPPAAAYK